MGQVEFFYSLAHSNDIDPLDMGKFKFLPDCNKLFFKFQGTQSANPHNDYCQHFVDTGQRPHNFIRDVGG